jgi:hypothetical protein
MPPFSSGVSSVARDFLVVLLVIGALLPLGLAAAMRTSWPRFVAVAVGLSLASVAFMIVAIHELGH